MKWRKGWRGLPKSCADQSLGFYSRQSLAKKALVGWRLVIDLYMHDLIFLSSLISLSFYGMVSSVLTSTWKDDVMFSITCKDVSFKIAIHPESSPYFHFMLNGAVFQFKVMCFILLVIPLVFASFHLSLCVGTLQKGPASEISAHLAC